jgi:hypothetical protein
VIRLLASALAVLLPFGIGEASGQGVSLPAYFDFQGKLDRDGIVAIEGRVSGDRGAALVVRIDDAASKDYASRANLERALPRGPFHWEIGIRGLRTSSGRPIDWKSVQGLRLFSPDGGSVAIASVSVKMPEPFAAGVLAYSFGAEDAPLFPGFTRVLPDNPMIVAGHPTAIRRPGPDPLVASGIAGVEKIKIGWREPRARVTLWTEDPGEWELLPHPLERRIRVNGTDVLYERLTPGEWLERRYLRGLRDEHTEEDDAWTAYGRKRGGLVSFEVNAAPEGLVIELAGDSPSATFLNAVVVEPAGQTSGRDEAEARRAGWYRDSWPVAKAGQVASPPAPSSVLKATGAPGSGLHVQAVFTAHNPIARPRLAVDAPALDGVRLDVRVWAAVRKLERLGAGGTVLKPAENALLTDIAAFPLRVGETRTYDLWITIPSDSPPGLYRGSIGIQGSGAETIPIEIEVLPVLLPPAGKAAGFYLDEAPQWNWFYGFQSRRRHQLSCDLKLLESFGILGNAPALSAPIGEGSEDFLSEMEGASAAHNAAPWLAYSAAKRVVGRVGAQESAAWLRGAEERAKADGLTPPIWSVADEPSNADSQGFNIKALVQTLRAGVPGIKLAAQLNSPQDAALAPLFDVAIVNQGFGIDEAIIARLKRSGADVWLYNTGRPRATAGLWLWLTEASRYVQWHARMPTADPFDPLDGREGDVQMIFPSAEACPAQPSIHRDLLRMAEGIADQRWLNWLAAQRTPEAEALAQGIRQRFGGRFDCVRDLSGEDFDALRGSIIELARRAQLSQR